MTQNVAASVNNHGRGSLPRGFRSPLLPGLAVAAAAVALAWLIHSAVPVLPFLTVSVVLGILSANLPGISTAVEGVLQPGLVLSAKRFMRLGIVLLGLKLSLIDVAALGWKTLGIVVAIVLLTFAGTLVLGKALRLPGDQALLLAAGFSICGASAIGTMSGVTKTDHRDTVVPIALVTLCGTLAIAVLPALQGPLGLDTVEFGYWVGASVHDVGQVVATAQTAGASALAGALIIKLTRVLMLAPMVTGAALVDRYRRRRATAAAKKNDSAADAAQESGIKVPPLIPLFVAGFMAMIVLRTLGIVPPVALEVAGIVQDLLLAAALFGLGASVRVRSMLQTSGKAIIAAMLSWALIAALAFVGVQFI
ncbi:putative sulfate exporter family transporter [Pseudarthrobacter sp. AL07]|uniref:YeiH family protein n=1 Tax=unclassified Pseudarthrobacter TaxID=2647000 RepID=UPI00249C1820|nr:MULTISPECIES: putative sulfate exporter family transporter [unclassified Pseudarthrobacter]MDI3195448.1 putative sulfate exporter family transporter [Pseudarthrobacter sp. AL20]MDI3209515.1 putative sulfate exporter family transporter [Pseudarthrobacter sp. AL07]